MGQSVDPLQKRINAAYGSASDKKSDFAELLMQTDVKASQKKANPADGKAFLELVELGGTGGLDAYRAV